MKFQSGSEKNSFPTTDKKDKSRFRRWMEGDTFSDDEEIASENENWLDVMIPYSDLVTLILVFFIFFYIFHTTSDSMSETNFAQLDQPKLTATQSTYDDSSAVVIGKDELDSLRQAEIDTLGGEKEHIFRISGEVLFASGSAEIKRQANSTLRLIGQQIKSKIKNDLNWQVRIEGHTDNIPIHTPIYKSNWELSTARAVSVVRFYVERGLFKPDQLQAMGYGEFKPVSSNYTAWGRKQNRRVEIKLSYKN